MMSKELKSIEIQHRNGYILFPIEEVKKVELIKGKEVITLNGEDVYCEYNIVLKGNKWSKANEINDSRAYEERGITNYQVLEENNVNSIVLHYEEENGTRIEKHYLVDAGENHLQYIYYDDLEKEVVLKGGVEKETNERGIRM